LRCCPAEASAGATAGSAATSGVEKAAGVRAARGRQDLWQIIDGIELDKLIRSFVPDQIIKDWPTVIRVVQAFKMDGNEGSMHSSGWEWYRGGVCKKYKCCKDDSGAAYAWVRFHGDPYDYKVYTESLKRGGDAFLVRQVPPACGAAEYESPHAVIPAV